MHSQPSKKTPASNKTDDVRRDLCGKLATGVREGAYGLQVRFTRTGDALASAWFYLYRDHEWHKRQDFAVSSEDIPELFVQLEMVASREITDSWSCRRVDHGDHTDFQLKFQPEPMHAHINDGLESYLLGRLFFGHHDTGEDSRARMGFRGR